MEEDLGHVVAQLRAHAHIVQGFEQSQAPLRVLEGSSEVAGPIECHGEALVNTAQLLHVEDGFSRLDRCLVTGDGLARLAGHIVNIGAMTEDPGLQHRVIHVGVLVQRQCLVPPAPGLMRLAAQVVGAPHLVVQFDRQDPPPICLGIANRRSQQIDGFGDRPQVEQRLGQAQPSATLDFEWQVRPGQQSSDHRLDTGRIALSKPGAGFGQDELDGKDGVLGVLQEILDGPAQPLRDDLQDPR